MYYGNIYIANGSVILKMTALPPAAPVTVTTIAKAVIYAAVKANMLTPIPFVPAIVATIISPITGRP